MMHVGLGRAHPLHVEYIHLGMTLAFIQDIMTEAILSHPRLPLQRKIAIVKALGKVIWIQNDLLAKWHVRDGDEFKNSDEEVIIEQEGYLHGRKILEDSESGEERPSSPASPSRIPRPSGAGVCPFAGVAASSESPLGNTNGNDVSPAASDETATA
jgi:hypothetical protein